MIVPADGVPRAGMDHVATEAVVAAQTGLRVMARVAQPRPAAKAIARNAPVAAIVAGEIFGGTTATAAAIANTRSVASLSRLCRKLR